MNLSLSLTDICCSYSNADTELPVLSDISFKLQSGEILSVVGPAGCGKSTLLSVIAGMTLPSSGQITIAKDPVIGYLRQNGSRLKWYRIYQNTFSGLRSGPKMWMSKRAALIRSLTSEPELLLFDEVFSSLDYQTRLELCDDIHQSIRRERKTAILVTHDLAEAVSFSDRILVLSPRPAAVLADFPIVFPDTAQTPSARRNTASFTDYLTEIWSKF